MKQKLKKEECQGVSRKKFLTTGALLTGYFLTRPFDSVFANNNGVKNIQPWSLKIEGDQLIIPAGNYITETGSFEVTKEGRFTITPATIKKAVDEELFLSADKPGRVGSARQYSVYGFCGSFPYRTGGDRFHSKGSPDAMDFRSCPVCFPDGRKNHTCLSGRELPVL